MKRLRYKKNDSNRRSRLVRHFFENAITVYNNHNKVHNEVRLTVYGESVYSLENAVQLNELGRDHCGRSFAEVAIKTKNRLI